MECNKLPRIRAHMVWGITSIDAVRLSSVDILLYYPSWLIMGHYPRLFVILTELDTEWRPIVRLWVSPKWKVSGPTKVATSLISMQCVWAMVVCFYTITTKCNGALNTFDCHINSVRCEMVVALLLVPSVQIAPRQPGKLIVASLPSIQFNWAVEMCFYTIDTM